ncbi:MAG: ABC transporter substrate-binding protein [Brockia lithotrophica]|nr:ABC transporter substrate-binding protein [Brockia lithotrophica]
MRGSRLSAPRAFVLLALFGWTLAFVAGCTQEKPSAEVPKRVGLTQFVAHPALDALRQGIVEGLAREGFAEGKNLVLDVTNAQGSTDTAASIGQKYASGYDLVIAIATPSAQAAAKAIGKTPLVFAAVTDPVAAGLVASLEHPGGTITGTSDVHPSRKSLELIRAFLPDARSVGVVYSSGEVNAVKQLEVLRSAAPEFGLEVRAKGVAQEAEIQAAAQALANQGVDAFLVLVDNGVVAAIESLAKVAEERRIPLFASDVDSVARGAVAAYGIDYHAMGVQTGELAARVLRGTSPGEIPVEVVRDVELVVNDSSLATYGLTLPPALSEAAKHVRR